MTKELAKQQPSELVVDNYDFLQDSAGEGLDFAQGDVATPLIYLLQKLSPQLDESSEKYVEGAKEGWIVNNVTNEVIDVKKAPVNIIPIYFWREIIEWIPRESGGGMVAKHPVDSDIMKQAFRNDKNKLVLSNGNNLVDTAMYVVLLQDPKTLAWSPVVIPFTSTKLKVFREFNSLIQNTRLQGKDGKPFTPPLFGMIYQLGSQVQKKNNNSFSNFTIARLKPNSDRDLFNECQLCHKQFKAGQFKIAEQENDADIEVTTDVY